jgi:hypothetical protein
VDWNRAPDTWFFAGKELGLVGAPTEVAGDHHFDIDHDHKASCAFVREATMGTIKFLDPRAAVNPTERGLVAGLDTLEGKVIGIIDNGQANSTTMFQELAKLIEQKLNAREVLFKTKPTHMQGAPKAIMDEFARRCDAVITGLGA